MKDPYIRSATVIRILDGDTIVCDVDLGFYVRVRMSCRLVGLNAPEHNEPGGTEATAYLTSLLLNRAVTVQSVSADKFAGRFDAIVVATDLKPGKAVIQVNAEMIRAGHAAAWDGNGPKPVPLPVR